MPKRRANGEGSIFKRKDGLWSAQYTDNIGQRRTLYGKTQQIVKEKLKEAIRQSDDGMLMNKSKITFVEWMREWLEVYSKPRVRPTTYAIYYRDAELHIIPAFPKVLLKDLRPDMLQKYFNEKAINGSLGKHKGGLSASRLRKIKILISQALEQAVENGLIPVNVALKIKLPPERKKKMVVLSMEEQKKIEAVLLNSDNSLYFAILLDLYTGLRAGELLGLKISDIDFDKKELHVQRTISRVQIPYTGKTEVYIGEPKTESGKRKIPLPEFIVELLKKHVEKVKEHHKLLQEYADDIFKGKPNRWINEDFLFISSNGCPNDMSELQRRFIEILEKADVRRVNLHLLRHTFATRCMEIGFDVKTLADILGHSDVKMTLNVYAHSLSEQKRSNMDRLSGVFNNCN